jgi:membrane-associated phospholipid phosphatase
VAGYGIIIALVAATRLDQRGTAWVLAAHLALPLLAGLATRTGPRGMGRVLHATYPVLILPALYASIDMLNGFGAVVTWDRPLLAIEEAIFGMQPARDWWRAAPSAFWSTVLHAVYFSYYVIVPLPVIVFLATDRQQHVAPYLAAVVAVFLCCYLTYVFAPVAGPYYEFERPTGPFVANAPARLVYGALSGGSAYGAAFPSSHVAATVAASIGAWRAIPRLGYLLAAPTTLLAVGVVYCQMHYVVDSAAGIVLGIGVPLAILRLERANATIA